MASFLALTQHGGAHDGARLHLNMDLVLSMSRRHEDTMLLVVGFQPPQAFYVKETLDEIYRALADAHQGH